MATSQPVFRVYVDWLNDGDFSDAYDDITALPGGNAMAGDGLTVAYGRDQARALSPPQPGAAAFKLNNAARIYSPENTASPLSGQVLPGRPVKITAAQDAATYTLYRGFLDDFTISPNKGDRSVTASCLDVLARFAQVTLSTPLYFTLRTGAVISVILDALGWPATARDLDVGASTFRWWWEEGTDGLTALTRVLNAEGPPAICFVDGQTGNFVFRDRHHRLLRPASVTSQATFTNGGVPDDATHATYSQPSAYDFGWRDIINTVTLAVDQRSPQPGPRTFVWSDTAGPNAGDGSDAIRATYAVPANATITVTAQASDPFTGATFTFPQNYLLLSGTVTTSLSRTSGQSTAISITDTSGAGSVVANLSITGTPVTVASTTPVTVQDTASATTYGIRNPPSTDGLNRAAAEDAAAVAAITLARYAQRRPIVTLPVASANGFRLAQQLIRDLSDRVHVTDSETGLDADCYIEQISHATTGTGRVLVTTFGCEKAPASAASPFTFDSTPLGFGTGQFDADSLDDPATLFIWDDPVQAKFGTGLWAT